MAESINKVTSKMLIKRTLKASLPKRLPIGELCYCTDVNELYIGDDEGNILINDKVGERGKSLEFSWIGTKLGIRVEGETKFRYVELGQQNIVNNKVDSVIQSLQTIRSDISKLKGRVTVVEDNIQVLDEDVTSLKQRVTTLEQNSGGSGSGSGSGQGLTEEQSIQLNAAYMHSQTRHVSLSDVDNAVQSYVESHRDELKGATGDPAENPNFSIGRVTALDPGLSPTVSIRGTYPNLIFDFGIPSGGGGSEVTGKEYIYYGRIPFEVTDGSAGPEGVKEYTELTEAMFKDSRSIITKIEPTTLGKTSLGKQSTTNEYDYCVILVPASSNYVVYMDDGLGGLVRFNEQIVGPDFGQMGANGNVSLTVDGVEYRLYGVFLLSPAEVFIYIVEE